MDAQMKEHVAQPSEVSVSKDMDLEGDLFGESGRGHPITHAVFVSSPAMKPSFSMSLNKRVLEDLTDVWMRGEEMEWDSRSPENICLEELDGMLVDF